MASAPRPWPIVCATSCDGNGTVADGPAGGLIIAAPASGSGKTVFTLGLLRHLAHSGLAVASAKVGPDYIDPAFHSAASGRPCLNMDPWAMPRRSLAAVARRLGEGAEILVCEGVMGLFDGATLDSGSTADLAAATGWPVVLVVDVRGQAASAAAVLQGFAGHRTDVHVAGAVFNRVGSARHAAILGAACAATVPQVPVLGCLPRNAELALPERHLGLVQAGELADLEAFLDGAAAPSRKASRSASSPACTRPRWRSGRASSALRGRHPSTGTWGTVAAQAAPRMAAWRALPTRLKTAPATWTSVRWPAKPCSTAAAEAACPRTSTTRTTGQPVAAARSAVEPLSRVAPSKSPMTPSHTRISAPSPRRRATAARLRRGMAQGSMLRQGRPLAALWNAGSM